ncbi:MAG: hypothetical protein ACTSP2_02800 [Alphaproteobacteria bacterium]
MTTLLIIGLVAFVGFMAWRGARTRLDEAHRVIKRRKTARDATVTLKKDPRTGVYRAPDDDA